MLTWTLSIESGWRCGDDTTREQLVAVFAFNVLGDGYRDALDPRLRGGRG